MSHASPDFRTVVLLPLPRGQPRHQTRVRHHPKVLLHPARGLVLGAVDEDEGLEEELVGHLGEGQPVEEVDRQRVVEAEGGELAGDDDVLHALVDGEVVRGDALAHRAVVGDVAEAEVVEVGPGSEI